MPEMTITIKNKVGLHARPATIFVKEAGKFQSNIVVKNGERQANAKSILSVMTLGAKLGSVLVIHAEGEDAEEALVALYALNEKRFGEQE